MIFIDELDRMRIYKKKFYLPINMKDRLRGNCVLLLTPNYESTINVLSNEYLNIKYYKSYFLDKSIPYVLTNEGYIDYEKTYELLNEVNLANPTLSSPNITVHGSDYKKEISKAKRRMKKHQYELNRLSNAERNAVGTKGNRFDSSKKKSVIKTDTVLDQKTVEVTNEDTEIIEEGAIKNLPIKLYSILKSNEEFINKYEKKLRETNFKQFTETGYNYTIDYITPYNILDLFLNSRLYKDWVAHPEKYSSDKEDVAYDYMDDFTNNDIMKGKKRNYKDYVEFYFALNRNFKTKPETIKVDSKLVDTMIKSLKENKTKSEDIRKLVYTFEIEDKYVTKYMNMARKCKDDKKKQQGYCNLADAFGLLQDMHKYICISNIEAIKEQSKFYKSICMKILQGKVNEDVSVEVTNESSTNNLYFISKNKNLKKLNPRVPDNFFTKNGYEDAKTKRVCFSTSIDGCLMGLSCNCENQEYYVFQPDGDYDVKKPTKKQVPDCEITNERWICEPVDIKCIGSIKVGKSYDDGVKFTYGNNNEYSAELYKWKYTFNEKVNEDVYVGFHNTYFESFELEDNSKMIFVTEEEKIRNTKVKKAMYLDRIKTNKDLFMIYDMLKEDDPRIQYTFSEISRYKRKNLLLDTFYYNNIFMRKNVLQRDKGVKSYFDLLNKLMDDTKLQSNGYNKIETVLVPLEDWMIDGDSLDYTKDINILSAIIRMLKLDFRFFMKWKGIDFVFMSKNGYFKCDLSEMKFKDVNKFKILITKLMAGAKDIPKDMEQEDSTKVIKNDIAEKIQTATNVDITKTTFKDDANSTNAKAEVRSSVDKTAQSAKNTDEAIDQMENEEIMKQVLDAMSDETDKVKLSDARVSRLLQAQDKSKEKELQGRKIRDILEQPEVEELPETSIEIDSINDEWKHMKYINFEKAYDIQQDILKILYSFSDKSVPVVPIDIQVEDTSTSEDFIYTYTVKMEDANGKRFTIKFDIPKFIDDKFMRLRGNEKTINGQLTFIGVVKSDQDCAQVLSNYKKIFIYRYGSAIGKSCSYADIINKFVSKNVDGKIIKFSTGNNRLVCSKYEVPMDYLDLATAYNTIEIGKLKLCFNLDKMYEDYDIKPNPNKIPVGYNANTKQVLYWHGQFMFSQYLLEIIYNELDRIKQKELVEKLNKIKPANKFTYSRANIMNHKIPLVIVMAYSEGLEKTMKKANIKYDISEGKVPRSVARDVIRFKDGYLSYPVDYNASLLMNGLKECNTEDYSITEMNGKSMWLDMLEIFGGRILGDGLDNFYDLMVDPITKETLERYKLPTDYCELLAYANFLLADNKYIKHTNMSARRYRSNELVAGYTYQALAERYGAYRTEMKKRGTAVMSIKQTAVIDKLMADPTCADLSMLNDIQNAEAINALSFKGLAGLNQDRSYDLEKRAYDESMLNNVAMSTGFAGNVGVTRQATMDMNIEGTRGYIKTIDGDTDKMSITKSFGVTEGMTPLGVLRDEPMRSAMNFIQTSKHGMRVKKSTPMLISNGTDMALPYMTSNVFSYNAKGDGKVLEVNEDYMIVEYKDGNKGFIDLRNKVRKNSNGGFYQNIKLDTDLKVGDTFKDRDVIAYDRSSYSKEVGPGDDVAYSNWTLCKVAMLTSDENFEDSSIISEWLSDAMASTVVVKKEVVLPKSTNVYSIVKKGQDISEGDPLIIFQNAFEDDDVNLLLKNLGDDEEDIITELGRIPVKSKVTGKIENVQIYRTCEVDELSDSLKKIVNSIEGPNRKIQRELKKLGIDEPGLVENTGKLDKTGKLKNVEDGILIEFYLSYEDKMSIGDKLIYGNGAKGTVKHVIPKGDEMSSEFRPDEPIHTIVPYFGLANRIICSVPITIAVNKIIVELDRKIKDMCDIPYKFIDED